MQRHGVDKQRLDNIMRKQPLTASGHWQRPGIFLLCLSLLFLNGVYAATPSDAQPRIAILSAFEPELKLLLANLKSPQTTDIHGQRFTTGQLQGQDVVLLLSGISMVNAAMSTQRVVDNFNVKAIVFSGIAGGVDPGLAIGDVVVADQWGQYLESVFARETAPGRHEPPAFLRADMANFGMIFPRATEVTRAGLAAPERRFWFPADAALLAAARQMAQDAQALPLERCTSTGKCLAHQPRLVVGGNGVSGSAFMDNAAMRDFLSKTLQARVLDMESAATAQVAYANGVPFIAFRSLSDLAGGDDRHNEMATFLTLASSNSAKTVQAFLAALPKPAVEAAPVQPAASRAPF